MSVYSEIQTQFSDPDLLIAALTASLGYTDLGIFLGDPQHIEGWSNADLAEIIVPKANTGTREDLGFRRGANGNFSVILSSVDKRKFGVGSDWEKSVKVAYAEQNILSAARKQGLRPIYTGKKLENGKLEYRFLKA